MSLSIYVS